MRWSRQPCPRGQMWPCLRVTAETSPVVASLQSRAGARPVPPSSRSVQTYLVLAFRCQTMTEASF